MRFVLLDCLYLKRKRSLKVDRSTFCAEWKSAFSLSHAMRPGLENSPVWSKNNIVLLEIYSLILCSFIQKFGWKYCEIFLYACKYSPKILCFLFIAYIPGEISNFDAETSQRVSNTS